MFADSVDFDGCIVNSDFKKNVPGPNGFFIELESREPKDYSAFVPMTYVIYPDDQNNPEKILYTYVDINKKIIGPRLLSELLAEADNGKLDSMVKHCKSRLTEENLKRKKCNLENEIKELDYKIDHKQKWLNKSVLESERLKVISIINDRDKLKKESLYENGRFHLADMKNILSSANDALHNRDFRSEQDKKNRLIDGVLLYNEHLVNYISNKNRNSESIMLIGSNRQYVDIERINCSRNETHSCFFLLQQLALILKSTFDPILMGDIANGKPYGFTLGHTQVQTTIQSNR